MRVHFEEDAVANKRRVTINKTRLIEQLQENLARHRRIISNPTLGTTFPSNALPGIPTITAPSSASLGSPSIVYQDRLDASLIPNGLGFHVLTATDSTGRNWRVFEQDTTVVGAETTRRNRTSSTSSIRRRGLGPWSICPRLCFSP